MYHIRGQIRLQGTDEPLAGFHVFLAQRWTQLGDTRTDSDGSFEFRFLRLRPSKLRILVRPPLDIYKVPTTTIRLGHTAEVEVPLYARCVFDATSVRNLTWEGRLLAEDGVTTLEGVEVSLHREPFTLARRTTDGRGFFRLALTDLPAGPYRLAVMTGNDLLTDTTREVELGEEDLYRNDTIMLTGPIAVPLHRVTVLGQASAGRLTTWAATGAEVRFVTGSYVLGRTFIGGGGHFHREKLYAPAGGFVAEVVPKFGLLEPGGCRLEVPESTEFVPTLKAEISLKRTLYLWAAVTLVPLLVCGTGWAGVRYWVLPEWKALRSGMAGAVVGQANSANPGRNGPHNGVKR